MVDKERPTDPGAGDEGSARGGFAKVAEHLNARHPTRVRPISRQLVHKWWRNRHWNRFPEAIEAAGSGNGGRGRPVFDLNATVNWYADYLRTRGGAPVEAPAQQATPRETGEGDTLAA